MVKGVIFDLGGVFFEDGTKKFLQILSSKLNLKLENLYPIFREGKSLEYRRNEISGKEFFNWASLQLDSKISSDELNLLWVSQYTEIEGMRGIILWLKSNKIKVWILSDNVPERVEFLQNKYHFIELFDGSVFSYEINMTKKNPAMFRYVLDKSGLKPEETVFVDDRQDYVEVAGSLNMKTIRFSDVESLKAKLSDYLTANSPVPLI